MNDPCRIYLKPAPGERLETAVTLPEERRSLLYGRVYTADGTPAIGLPVLLFAEEESAPLLQAITDESGAFCFGPVPGDRLYAVHIFRGSVKVRTVEVDA